MTRKIIGPVVVVLLGAGLLYSAMQIRDLSSEVKELRVRVARAEAPPMPRVEAEPTVLGLPEAPSDGDIDLVLQVDALQAEMAALKAALGISGSAKAGDAPGKVGSGGGTFVAAPSGPGAAPAAILAALTPAQQDQPTIQPNQVDHRLGRLLVEFAGTYSGPLHLDDRLEQIGRAHV